MKILDTAFINHNTKEEQILFNIKSELKRAIFSKNSLIAFTITLIALLVEIFNTLFSNGGLDFSNFNTNYDSPDVFLRCLGHGDSGILCFIAPLLAALIFSTSYLSDKDSNFLKFIYTRMDKKKYIISRIIVTALSSGIVITAAMLLNLIIIVCMLGFKTNSESILLFSGSFAFLYYKNKWLYIIYVIFNSFIFSAIFSLLGLGLSPFINNKYLAFLCPFAIYIFSMTVTPYIGLSVLNMGTLFLCDTPNSIAFVIIYESVLLIVGAALFYIGVLFRNEKDL